MESFLIYISHENKLLIVDLDKDFKINETLVDSTNHFSINRNMLCSINSNRTIEKYKIEENGTLQLMKAVVVFKSKKYIFHTICTVQ